MVTAIEWMVAAVSMVVIRVCDDDECGSDHCIDTRVIIIQMTAMIRQRYSGTISWT